MEKQKFDWETISLKIITHTSSAKTYAFKAMRLIKEKQWLKADSIIALGNLEIEQALKIHLDIVTAEANGAKLEFKLLFMHAEDQLLSTQTLLELVKELITLFKAFQK